jgi:hypothetical protein
MRTGIIAVDHIILRVRVYDCMCYNIILTSTLSMQLHARYC